MKNKLKAVSEWCKLNRFTGSIREVWLTFCRWMKRISQKRSLNLQYLRSNIQCQWLKYIILYTSTYSVDLSPIARIGHDGWQRGASTGKWLAYPISGFCISVRR
jgi:hypothetical protein